MKKENLCKNCGCIRHSKALPGVCRECKTKLNRHKTSLKYKTILNEKGYIIHSDESVLWNKIKNIDVTRLECNHTFNAQIGNLVQGLTKCSICGPKQRAKKMLARYLKKYKAQYDLEDRKQYGDCVRRLSEQNWKKAGNKQKRGHNTIHLDHKVPIAYGFKNKIPPEAIADLLNLQLLPVIENIQKQDYHVDNEVLKALSVKYDFKDFTSTIVEADGKTEAIIIDKSLNLVDTFSYALKHNKTRIIVDDLTICLIPFTDHVKLDTVIRNIETKNSLCLFEDELEGRKKRLIESRINNKLNKSIKIYARKTELKEIDAITASRFMQAHHIQGNAPARIKLGLYFNNELVSVMTFGKPRFSKKYDWEIIRFANKLDHLVIGAASKLFSHFVKENSNTTIMSYSDRRWGNGGVYEKMGMQHVGKTLPNYWWVKNNKRLSRYETRLDDLPKILGPAFDKMQSEDFNMRANGWFKIEDLGNDIFVYWPKNLNI
ncbi:MAG: hypothetical protein QXN55_01215 [Candidatus Nitrosotenuis sp.]